MSIDKSRLRAAIIEQLRRELVLQVRAAALARDEATSEESRAENKYDTRGQEAAYLAEGQARLAGEIEAAIALYATLPLGNFGADDPIALGAVVETSDGRDHHGYFLGPRAGGLELVVNEQKILVITPLSPLGRELLGRRVGDVLAGPKQTAGPPQRIVSIA
jgi:transcription elongation GreA/GreB family factor